MHQYLEDLSRIIRGMIRILEKKNNKTVNITIIYNINLNETKYQRRISISGASFSACFHRMDSLNHLEISSTIEKKIYKHDHNVNFRRTKD